VIRLSIAQQRLTAYEDGKPILTTVVATGQAALPTPTGTFQVSAKYTPYTFISPWPKGNRFWYPTLTVSWAMLFHDGGYFLHDSPHRTLYGPGANLVNGTHGCVNVPTTAMGELFSWADVGTTVVIE
jgi:lipoprotein-anchoring transpeptidase ErfK/SrfK